MEEKNKQYVVFRHLTMPHKGLCFYSTNNPDEPEEEKGLSFEGERWYEVIGYADTHDEALHMCENNYGGLPSNQEFEDWAKQESLKQGGAFL